MTTELLATVDLGPEIEGMAGRQLRLCMFTYQHRPSRWRCHGLRAGGRVPEDRNTRRWLENRVTVPAIEISADIVQSAR